ncbi:MAG: hypothetical protein QXU18_10735, partial [Thermoplasmatales archaeon]
KEYDDILESFANQFGSPKVCARFLAVVFSSESPDIEKATTLMARFSNGNIPAESLEALYRDGEYVMAGSRRIVLSKGNSRGYVLELQDEKGTTEIKQDFKIKNKSEGRLINVVNDVVRQNEKLVLEKGDGAFGLLMGEVMKQVRGEFEGKEVSNLLKKRISETVQGRNHP